MPRERTGKTHPAGDTIDCASQKVTAVDRTVADLNIAYFRKLLSTETDPAKRQTIERLLAEEEAKLTRAQHPKEETPDRP